MAPVQGALCSWESGTLVAALLPASDGGCYIITATAAFLRSRTGATGLWPDSAKPSWSLVSLPALPHPPPSSALPVASMTLLS